MANMFRMAREGLDRVLPSAVRVALAQEAPVIRSRVGLKSHGETSLTDVLIAPVAEFGALQGLLLVTSDVGRPSSALTSHLDYAMLLDDAREVLRSLVAHAQEVRTHKGAWYLVRSLPYRTSANVIAGLVITFVAMNNVKQAEAARQQAIEQLEVGMAKRQRAEEQLRWRSQALLQAPVPLIVDDTNGSLVELNTAVARLYGWRREELLELSSTTLVPAASQAQVDSFLAPCRQGASLDNVESFRQTKAGEVIPVRLPVSPLTHAHGELLGIITMATHPLH